MIDPLISSDEKVPTFNSLTMCHYFHQPKNIIDIDIAFARSYSIHDYLTPLVGDLGSSFETIKQWSKQLG